MVFLGICNVTHISIIAIIVITKTDFIFQEVMLVQLSCWKKCIFSSYIYYPLYLQFTFHYWRLSLPTHLVTVLWYLRVYKLSSEVSPYFDVDLIQNRFQYINISIFISIYHTEYINIKIINKQREYVLYSFQYPLMPL